MIPLLVAALALSAARVPLTGIPAAGNPVVQASEPVFRASFPSGVTRTWVGPSLWATRLQDWRIHDGRLECVESAEGKPMRVVHALTTAVAALPGTLTIRVRTGLVDPDRNAGAASWTGFLVGAGGEAIDYRLTALCHHRPAEDGGLVAALDGTGRVVFRDFEHNVVQGGWGIAGRLHADEMAELPAAEREGDGFGAGPFEAVDLELEAVPDGDAYRLTLTARHAASGALVSRATLAGVAPRLVEGSLALASHRGGHWFEDWSAAGTKVALHPERAFGPVLATQYTLSRGVLKLTAQMPPLGAGDARTALLQVQDGEGWRTVASSTLVQDARTFPFRVEDWSGARDVPFRVVYELRTGPGESRGTHYTGTIRREPGRGPAASAADDELMLAAFTGNKHFTGGIRWNHGGVWFPHAELVAAVTHHDPDLLFFSGDQIYEGDLTGAQRRPPETAILDYLDKWYRWCWAFRDLTRDRPCVAIPDDHDVYHGNIWGAGGRHAQRQDDGGYTMPPDFVRAVEATQTSHLPDPYDPTPVEQGIGVYYTSLDYGGLSFAVLEDRKFKSSPTRMVPEGQVKNGWFQDAGFDPREADVEGAVLLGERQLAFLEHWAADWSGGTWMKVALSQTIFANVATIPSEAQSGAVLPGLRLLPPDVYPENEKLAADCDSNGWPQTGRNRALTALRRAFALHVAGDQHLGSCVRYGVDDWDDAGWALCVPSIANTWPRRWFPPEPGADRAPGAPRYTGRFMDGFGNHVTVHAVSNPHRTGREPAALHDRAPGYGIVRFRRATREIVIECWPRWVDPSAADAAQYPGWPITIHQRDNYGREPAGHLPELRVAGMEDPVVQVASARTGEIAYTLRIAGTSFRPPVFGRGPHLVRVGEPGTERWRSLVLEPARADDPEPAAVEVDLAWRLGPATELPDGRVAVIAAELAVRGREDQAVRKRVERRHEMRAVDTENTRWLKALAADIGWIDVERFGRRAAGAAFLLVQHSGDVELMTAALPEIERDVRAGRLDGQSFALLHDRLQLRLGGKQRYGTQVFEGPDGLLRLRPCEDLSGVDERRAELRLMPLERYLDLLEQATGKRVSRDGE